MGRKNPPSQARGGKGKGIRRHPEGGGVSRRDRFGDVDNMTRPDSAIDEPGIDRNEDSEGEESDEASSTFRIYSIEILLIAVIQLML